MFIRSLVKTAQCRVHFWIFFSGVMTSTVTDCGRFPGIFKQNIFLIKPLC